MNKIRVHVPQLDGTVASVYISNVCMNAYKIGGWTIYNAYSIGAIVGKSRRANNDWYCGDKSGHKFHNHMTGISGTGFLSVAKEIKTFVTKKISLTGECSLLIDGTDEKRRTVYNKGIQKYAAKCGYKMESYATGYGEEILYILYL